MRNELKIALITGPAYDPLYRCLPAFTESTEINVQVAYTGDHPALNAHLASLNDVPYDLVSTHTKYAPSQQRFLAPLNDVVDGSILEDFVPLLLKMASIN